MTDLQVDEMRRLRREHGVPLKVLAVQFAVSYWTVAKIVRYERRNVEIRLYE